MFGRMSRQDWLANFFPLPRVRQRKRKAKLPALRKKPSKFRTVINGKIYTFKTFTKSEFRAMVKEISGNPIPPGTQISKLK